MASYAHALLSDDIFTAEDLVTLGFDHQHASDILEEPRDFRAEAESDEEFFTSQMDRADDVLDAFRIFERNDTFRPKYPMTVAEINNHRADYEFGIV